MNGTTPGTAPVSQTQTARLVNLPSRREQCMEELRGFLVRPARTFEEMISAIALDGGTALVSSQIHALPVMRSEGTAGFNYSLGAKMLAYVRVGLTTSGHWMVQALMLDGSSSWITHHFTADGRFAFSEGPSTRSFEIIPSLVFETACPIVSAREHGQAQATEILQRADGSRRTVIITAAGMVGGLQVQVMRDETDLEAARRARDSILANISHEFRTPLAAQLASIELLQENLHELPREQLEELVTSLRRGSLRLTRLIDNLLESVRIESGQVTIRQQHLNLHDVVQDAVELVGSLFPQRGQTLVVDVSADLPTLVGDGPRLTQVFVNLLANANKFGPEGSTVRVAAQAVEAAIEVTVDDAGPGVTENERGSIFEQFHRATGEEPEPRGLGLGLWIVKSIVERHGGTVIATQDPQGLTRFVVRLPCGGRANA